MTHPQTPYSSDRDRYDHELHDLQVELVKLQRHIIHKNQRVLILIEGRDAAGKDGTIKRISEHLSPRETRIVAPGKPSDREDSQWYFQRFVRHLPAAQEIVLFNRSWYNRAGVERVMGYCTPEDTAEFLEAAPQFERMLARSGTILLKYYLDITRHEQARRLRARRRDPLKQWKISPVDKAAQRYWREYSRARDAMLLRTHHADGPWTVVAANDKHQARLAVIRNILSRVKYAHREGRLLHNSREFLRPFSSALLQSRWLAR